MLPKSLTSEFPWRHDFENLVLQDKIEFMYPQSNQILAG